MNSPKKKETLLIFLVVLILVVLIISNTVLLFLVTLNSPYHKSRQLIKAIKQHDYDTMEIMLEAGVDPNVPDARITKLNGLFETAPDVPIDIAAKMDDIKAVKMLLQYGATPNQIEGTRSHPLHSAIFKNGENVLAIVKELVEHGADPYEEHGSTNVFYWVAGKRSPNDSNADLRMMETMDYLFETFCEDPQSISQKSHEIWSLTTYAIYRGKNIQLIQFLIDKRGTIDFDSSYAGESFYDYCHKKGNEKLLSLMEQNGGFPEDLLTK